MFLLILWVSRAALVAQTDLDSLQSRFYASEDPILKTDICIQLGQQLRYSDPEQAIRYAKIGVQLSNEVNLPKKKRTLYYLAAVLLKERDRFDEAEQYAQQLIAWATERADTIGIIQGLSAAGEIAQQRGQYELAMDYFIRQIDYAEQKGSLQNAIIGELNISTILSEIERYRDAIARIQTFFVWLDKNTVARSDNFKQTTGILYINLAYNYEKLEQPDSALDYLQRAEQILLPIQADGYLSDVYYIQAKAYLQKRQFDASKQAILKAIRHALQNDPEADLGAEYNLIGFWFLEQLRPDSASYYLQRAQDFLQQDPDALAERVKNYQYLSQLHEQNNNLPKALFFFKKYQTASDSLLNAQRIKQVQDLQISYQTAKKERENIALKLTQEQQAAEIRQANLQNILLTLMMLAVLVILGQRIYMYRKLNRKNTIIQTKNNQLSTLIRDHHHRFKNQYQFLTSLIATEARAGRMSQEVSKAYRNRIKAMSEMEELLMYRDFTSETTGDIQIKALFDRFAQHFEATYARTNRPKVICEVIPEELLMPIDAAGTLILLVSELSTNAIKHNPDQDNLQIHIRLGTNSHTFDFSLQDNGKGWQGYDPQQNHSVGWDIIQTLIQTLHKSELELFDDQGAGILIRFAARAD